jgi:hypothetical protein
MKLVAISLLLLLLGGAAQAGSRGKNGDSLNCAILAWWSMS